MKKILTTLLLSALLMPVTNIQAYKLSPREFDRAMLENVHNTNNTLPRKEGKVLEMSGVMYNTLTKVMTAVYVFDEEEYEKLRLLMFINKVPTHSILTPQKIKFNACKSESLVSLMFDHGLSLMHEFYRKSDNELIYTIELKAVGKSCEEFKILKGQTK